MSKLAAIRQMGYKFFEVVSGKEYHFYNIDTCEECGEECLGVNGVKVGNVLKETLLKAGMTERKAPAEELGHCEALGLAVCPDCYVDDSEPLDDSQNARAMEILAAAAKL